MKSLICKQYESAGLHAGTTVALARPLKEQPYWDNSPKNEGGQVFRWARKTGPYRHMHVDASPASQRSITRLAPFAVGDVVACRERYCTLPIEMYEKVFAAGHQASISPDFTTAAFYDGMLGFPVRSPVTMPLWAVRTHVEVTSVAVVRLWSLNLFQLCKVGLFNCEWSVVDNNIQKVVRALWNQTYGRGAWEANPWLWFWNVKKVTP